MPLTVRGKTASAAPAATLDRQRLIDTAEFWALEWLWFEHRMKRLKREREAVEAWLSIEIFRTLVETEDLMRYSRRSARSIHCESMRKHYLNEMQRVADLFAEIADRQPKEVQAHMTEVWFRTRDTAPVPDVRPTRRKV